MKSCPTCENGVVFDGEHVCTTCAARPGDAYEPPAPPSKRKRGKSHNDRGPSRPMTPEEQAERNGLPPPSRLRTRRMADVPPASITWLWPGRIPRGAITLIDGDPGLGKSTVILDVAARVSRGWAMPPEGGPGAADPQSVLILTAEDDASATVRPRLEAGGADLQRVIELEAVQAEGGERPPILPADLREIRRLIDAERIALVIVDPIMAYLDGAIDAHRDQEVRRALHALKVMAQETGAAIVLVRHLNKSTAGGPALYRGGGSIGITGAARSGLLVGRHPDKADTCVIVPIKCNLCRPPRSLTYSLESVGMVARVAWGAECELSADDVLARPASTVRRKTAAEQCADAIREYLAGGPRPSEELTAYLEELGYKDRTITTGRQLAKVKAMKDGAKWVSSLPEPAEERTRAP